MITYSRLAAKVWRQMSQVGPGLAPDLRQDEMENLDREILEWYDKAPDEVKGGSWHKEKQAVSTPSHKLQRLRIWTYLRLNQVSLTRPGPCE